MKIEQAKQLTEQALDQLIAALEAGKSETLKAYLILMSQVHRYSFGNIMLIAFQRPSATRVAGFTTWKSLGRFVKKGEKLFWSVTVYDFDTMSGLDNGQPFPSLNQMDKPAANPDGSFDVHFGPRSAGKGNNWLSTVPGKRFWVCLRLYGPGKAFFDQTWKPDDVVKVK